VSQFQVGCGREPHEKREILRRLLRDAKDLQNAIIFCNRKREVAVVYKSLQKHGFSVGALHGDMDQSARTAALDQFRKGEIPLLVASDVAARGLDIPAVSHVFNFDVPHHADDYVHRIGRTGRAGRAGTAISNVTSLDNKSLAAIERLIGKNIPLAEGDYDVPSVASDETGEPRQQRSREGSRGGRKPRREREPRAAKSSEREPRAARSSEREPRHAKGAGRNGGQQPQAASEAFTPPTPAQPSRVPSIGRPEPRRAQREAESEPADHSHLPAFLLRPVRARV
jgi:superfamily II DNA/RNA helicase